MLEIGRINKLKVNRVVDFGFYLAFQDQQRGGRDGNGEVLLPINSALRPHEEGAEVDVFIYRDSEDRLIASEERPKGLLDEFVGLKVKTVTSFGAFLDWGLLKDLLVPNREQHRKMKVGQTYVVRIMLDTQTDRLIGVSKIEAFLQKQPSDLVEGEKVTLLVYDKTEIGFKCIVNEHYAGLLYKTEAVGEVSIGKNIEGFVKKIREDHKLDLTMYKSSFEHLEDDVSKLLQKLKDHDGVLALHDKSAPEQIWAELKMSKKQFKKVIGNLYKKKMISIEDNGIRLL